MGRGRGKRVKGKGEGRKEEERSGEKRGTIERDSGGRKPISNGGDTGQSSGTEVDEKYGEMTYVHRLRVAFV